MCYEPRKESKQEMNYFGTTTVTVFAGFVKKDAFFLTQEISTSDKCSHCGIKKGATRYAKIVEISCALNVTIISKLNYNFI